MTRLPPQIPGLEVVDELIGHMAAFAPLSSVTDKYFTNTRIIAAHHAGDAPAEVTYAVFLRHPCRAALEPAIRLIARLAPRARVERLLAEGERASPNRPLLYVTGAMAELVELETLLLQKVGLCCLCALNAYDMCRALPGAVFLDMHARHGFGPETNILAAYGAATGSAAAKADDPAVKGFIGSSQELTAPLYGAPKGLGTMPHGLVGLLGGDVLRAAKVFAQTLPEEKAIYALVDYRGLEIDDSLACADWFYRRSGLAARGRTFGVRLDTHGARYAQGLDRQTSVKVVGDWIGIRGEAGILDHICGVLRRREMGEPPPCGEMREILFGPGVSAAAVIHTRKALDDHGFPQARIVVSSGFDVKKCRLMGAADAPIDMVGTGSFLPATMSETFAVADIIRYGGDRRVKTGREFLLD